MRVALPGAFGLLITTAIVSWFVDDHAPGNTSSNYDRIKQGMVPADVERLRGALGEVTTDTTPTQVRGERILLWPGQHQLVWVGLDRDRVTTKYRIRRS